MLLQSLRARLFAPQVASPAPAAERAKPWQDAQGIELFEQVVCGSHMAALQAGAVASAFNALAAKRRMQSPLSLRNYVPRRPTGAERLARCGEEMGLESDALDAVEAFLAHLYVIDGDVEGLCADIERNGRQAALAAQAERLGRSARLIGTLALQAVDALDAVARVSLPMHYGHNTTVLRTLLAQVVQGGSPCLDKQGNAFLPELPQRRPAPRRRVGLACVLEHQGHVSRAVIANISASGAGLEQAPRLVPQTVVIIEVTGGRCLAGVVVWGRGTTAGVKFDHPLGADDPLLAV